jgi:hypothetical protein
MVSPNRRHLFAAPWLVSVHCKVSVQCTRKENFHSIIFSERTAGSPNEFFFLEAYCSVPPTFCTCADVFLNFQAAMGKRQINIKFQLVSVKIVTKPVPVYSSEAA